MVKILGEDGYISCLKKGAQYFAIYTDLFTFTDVLHFTSPCKYSNYLKQWGVEEEKSIFPYQFYNTVEELEAATDFPPPDAFYSDLTKSDVSEDDYIKAKAEFDQRKTLPGKYLYIYTSIYMYIYISMFMSIYMSIYLSIYMFIYEFRYILYFQTAIQKR